jgi:hypothetical protein
VRNDLIVHFQDHYEVARDLLPAEWKSLLELFDRGAKMKVFKEID